MTQESYELTVGSKYEVVLSEEETVQGHFAGYCMIGTESAIVITRGARLRFIPVAQILYIDLIEAAKPERKERPEHLYG